MNVSILRNDIEAIRMLVEKDYDELLVWSVNERDYIYKYLQHVTYQHVHYKKSHLVKVIKQRKQEIVDILAPHIPIDFEIIELCLQYKIWTPVLNNYKNVQFDIAKIFRPVPTIISMRQLKCYNYPSNQSKLVKTFISNTRSVDAFDVFCIDQVLCGEILDTCDYTKSDSISWENCDKKRLSNFVKFLLYLFSRDDFSYSKFSTKSLFFYKFLHKEFMTKLICLIKWKGGNNTYRPGTHRSGCLPSICLYEISKYLYPTSYKQLSSIIDTTLCML